MSAIVVGDLLLDVVVAPDSSIRHGTDTPGSVCFRQGGSAATTARWLARLGVVTALVTGVGDDLFGSALVDWLADRGVRVHARVLRRVATGRLAVVIDRSGERSFTGPRGAVERLRPADIRPAWFKGAAVVHVPFYSLICEPLGSATLRAVALGRAEGATISFDLSSSAPLLTYGRSRVLALLARVKPDIVFANESEAQAVLKRVDVLALLRLAPLVVLKRGSSGAFVVWRSGPTSGLEVPVKPLETTDTTGAGDAFDAGFLASWLREGRPPASADSLRRAVLAGHRAAAAELSESRPDLFLTWLRSPRRT